MRGLGVTSTLPAVRCEHVRHIFLAWLSRGFRQLLEMVPPRGRRHSSPHASLFTGCRKSKWNSKLLKAAADHVIDITLFGDVIDEAIFTKATRHPKATVQSAQTVLTDKEYCCQFKQFIRIEVAKTLHVGLPFRSLPGAAGLKDCRLAKRWEISRFTRPSRGLDLISCEDLTDAFGFKVFQRLLGFLAGRWHGGVNSRIAAQDARLAACMVAV